MNVLHIEEHSLNVFEEIILRQIFGTNIDEKEWRIH